MTYDQDVQALFLFPVGVKFTKEHKARDWNVRPIVEIDVVVKGEQSAKETIFYMIIADDEFECGISIVIEFY